MALGTRPTPPPPLPLTWISALPLQKISNSHSTLRQFRTFACARNPNTEQNPNPPPIPLSPPTPLLDALASESSRIRANFFCPGHKQGELLHPPFQALTYPAPNLDLPELPALDNLFAPEGVIEEAQTLAAQVFTTGCDEWQTFFLVNGTTCGIQAAILATVRPGAKVLLPRNVHQSAVHALVLSGAVPVWLQPAYDAKHDLLHGVSASQVAKAFNTHQGNIDAVLLVTPTYHGVCSDVDGIVRVSHDHGAFVIVDEAHGSHFAFHNLLPKSATFTDADIVVQSTHKTLPALSQAAMLHARNTVSTEKVASALQLVQSTSPNYLLLASLDSARAHMQAYGEDLMSRTIDLARNAAVRIASLDGYSVLGVDNVGISTDIHALDPTRITVLLQGDVTGYDLDTHLIDRFGVYAELPSFKHITFVLTPGNTKEDVDQLVTALALFQATSDSIDLGDAELPSFCDAFGEETDVTPRAAFFSQAEIIPVEETIGRICVETLCPYPPGIPVLVAGERITSESVHVLKSVLDAGGSVSGASDETLSTIRVMKREEEDITNGG